MTSGQVVLLLLLAFVDLLIFGAVLLYGRHRWPR